jgi:uncharacterized membrane protein YhaH (DUF805 family)
MHWFLDPIQKHYVDFAGRVGRQEYWMFILISVLLQAAFDVVGLDEVSMLIALGLLVPSLGLAARRLHDTGKSGWWQLLMLVPIIGWIILIVWLATKTDPVANEYGEPAVPKQASVSPAAAPVSPTAAPMAADTAPASERRSDESDADGGGADGGK